ncbi:hypothetical protein Desor_3829 [Desulfosporosinus orientis DSM 765]|uniref:DUF2178 domain-containing protein n=1 Tax=Desulfosporosinus orientis (strain ATCC 19365 / DSM 765 / NCIMB 8382 / VKM B-1628 / Singapore I) TaxID=768706 RepID=G7W9F1_DESOD|nr:hypothetical protein [Desulfosporosinus orientis]AET69288.1 hypothetical protein Desor_3829 [Desulfosporosinus orientis DSM 765]
MILFAVKKQYLLLIAGCVWMFAGFMVMKTGYPFLKKSTSLGLILLGAAIIFLIFYLKIFSKLVKKHETRIRDYEEDRVAFWRFFDKKQYIIIAIMMSGGILMRSYHIVPDWFIAFFYPGLGFALFSCGTRFVARYIEFEWE